jgi:hypothetical protein
LEKDGVIILIARKRKTVETKKTDLDKAKEREKMEVKLINFYFLVSN